MPTPAARIRRSRGRRALAWAAACAVLACAAPPTALERWAAARPELAGRELGHLGEATPYVVALRDQLLFFWCRWPLTRPLTVALPADADAAERKLLWRAFAAWQEAVPGLSFREAEAAAGADWVLLFDEGGSEGASAAAECSVRTPLPPSGPLEAALVRAELRLRRGERDAWGRPVALGAAERLGAALHEIGHALGLQGHARLGRSVLSRNVDAVRRIGRRVARGRPLEEPAMAALYALPSGTRIERRDLPAGSTAALDVALDRSPAGTAVEVAVGDRAARFRSAAAPGIEYWLKDPAQLFARTVEFGGLIEQAAGRAGAQPIEGSSWRALASRFAAGAGSPRVLSTSESQ